MACHYIYKPPVAKPAAVFDTYVTIVKVCERADTPAFLWALLELDSDVDEWRGALPKRGQSLLTGHGH